MCWIDNFAIMSDSLPTICADQLTKAVNLAAAGTLTALDEENDEEQEHVKDKWEKAKQIEVTEASSPLPSLKLLEALSSSMTSNLPQLCQIDNAYHSDRVGVKGNNSCKNRQRIHLPDSAAPPAVKKYSNRKNYKLLPPVIPSQIRAGVRKVRPVGLQHKPQVVTLNPSSKSISQNGLVEYQVRPLSMTGSNVMLMSPPNSHVSQKSPRPFTGKSSPVSAPSIEKSDLHLKCAIVQRIMDQDKTPVKEVLPIRVTGSSFGSKFNAPVISASHIIHPPLNPLVTAKVQDLIKISQEPQATASNQNQRPFIATSLSKSEQNNEGGIPQTLFDSRNMFSQSSCKTQANNSLIYASGDQELKTNTPANPNSIRDPLKDLASIASKSVYVPILPQPPMNNPAAKKVGQLVFKDSCLYMIQPNGSLQAIAFVHPQIINSSTANTYQSNSSSLSHCESVSASTNFTSGNSTKTVSSHPTNQCFLQTTSMTLLPSKVSSCSSSSTSVISQNISSNLARTDDISESQTALLHTNNGKKTVLATVIAAPSRAEATKKLQSSVSTMSTASPPSAALQYLAKLLRPKSISNPEHLNPPTVNTEKEMIEVIKQPLISDVGGKTINQDSYCKKSTTFCETVLSPRLQSNGEHTLSTFSSPHSDNPVFHTASMSSSHDLFHSECPSLTELNDIERDNASATAVAAAAMMSLSQTTDHMPRCDTMSLNPTSRNEALSKPLRPLVESNEMILSDLSTAESPSEVTLVKSSESSINNFQGEHTLPNTPQTNSLEPKKNHSLLQSNSAQKFDSNFLVPSTCGKKLIVSPGGIKHLQSILRQKGISEGYFVITSPRVSNQSLPVSQQQEIIKCTSSKKYNDSKLYGCPNQQSTEFVLNRDMESEPKDEDQGENENKSCPKSEIHYRGENNVLRGHDFDCEDSDDSSCTSGSSSTALVIETGEEDEQERAHQTLKKRENTSTPDHAVQKSGMNFVHEKNINNDQSSKVKTSDTSPSSDVLDKFHANSYIPQSPLSLSDLVRQQASRNGLLNDKESDYMYFKSPGNARKEMFDNIREMPESESNEFALPAPVIQSQACNSQHLQHSPTDAVIDTDDGPDYRSSVLTPGSLLPVDLSYERDSHLAGTVRSEHESVMAQSPPKVTSATNVSSPKSPFMVSSVNDHGIPLNPPMTPNTMLINLLNRVPTPLLTNNQDLLTLPTSQESRTFELSSSSKLKDSVLGKRDESMCPEKSQTYTDSQEYADSLSGNSFFPPSRKSMNMEQSPFETPQNALALIASNYTVSNNASEPRPDSVNQMHNFELQNSETHTSFERSVYPNTNQNTPEDFPVTFEDNSNCHKVYQNSVQHCDHLLVTVNLDSDAPAFAVPVSHSHESYLKAGQNFQTGNSSIICSQHILQTSGNLQHNFSNVVDDRAQASNHIEKSVDTDILRHLITSTNTSYPSRPSISELSQDTSSGNFNHLIDHQQLSHFPSRLNNLFTNQTETSQAEPRLSLQFSQTEKNASDSLGTFPDTSFKKNTFSCTISSGQINESPLLHDQRPGAGEQGNLPYVIGNAVKQHVPMSHGFKITGKHITQFHSDPQESNVYFHHSHDQDSLQTLRQDSEHNFHSNGDQCVNSYDQTIQELSQNSQQQTLASVFEHNPQVYGQTNQENLQTYDHSNPQSGLPDFNPNHQQKVLHDFDGARNLHSFTTTKHPQGIQTYEDHPGSHAINYNMESMPMPPADASDHGYSSSSLTEQDSSRIFAHHPDQMNYMIEQQFPPPPPSTYFTSSTEGGMGSAMPSLFSEQCAIGSEAPMLDGSNSHHTHPCSGAFNHSSQGLQHIQQPYPYPSKQTGSENVPHSQPRHETGEASGSLEKQPVLPSASFSPPSVADQAASQAAAAEVNGGDNQYSGTFPNLSIYDMYLRGSNTEARGGPSETDTLPGNFCVECNTMYKTQCKFHSCEYTYVSDTPILSHARLTLPSCLFLGESSIIGHTNSTGVFAKEKIAMRTKFGPLTGSPVSCDQLGSTRSFSLWQTFMGGSVKVMDSSNENTSNWLMFVKPARVSREQNLVAFQHGHSVYFVTRQEIQPQQELLYWFAKDYARILGITDKSKSTLHMLCPHCSICKHIFPDKKELRSHQRSQHPRPCNKQCNQCSKQFSQVSHLKAHIASVHSQVKRFVCTQCGKRFSDSSNFKKHVKLHSREKAFKCQLCGRAFQQKSHLKSHMNTHMPVKSEQCGFCGERFTRAFTRRQHELQHTKQNKIQCEQCGKIFYKQKIYKNHLKIHRDERNYSCQQCHRAFRTKGNLLRHGPTCKQRKCLTLPACPPALPSQQAALLPPQAPPPHLSDFAASGLCDSATSSGSSSLLSVLSSSDPSQSGLGSL